MSEVAILVVEDNPITRKVVRLALEAQQMVVHEAPDGATAIAEFTKHSISLVLLDLLLPDSDGFELLVRIRALPNGLDVPILAFSGLLAPGDEARVSSVGFNDVVTKPVEPTRLIQIVRAHLPPTDPLPVVSSSRAPLRLVVADDDAVQRKLVGLRLQRAGFKVTLAADGEEALARARELQPDAIVSDVLMPRLDGFGLCMAVRNDPALATTPVVLVTNSYLDAEDQVLAKRAGANDLIVRTPELKEVLLALERAVRDDPRPAPGTASATSHAVTVPIPIDPDLERERTRRVMNQLERQVQLNAGVNQRYALLAAELSVLSGISQAVATQRDLKPALDQVLASCFDAGGISLGALYLLEGIGDARQLRAMRYGAVEAWKLEEVQCFFGQPQLLDECMQKQQLFTMPAAGVALDVEGPLLERARARSMIVAPLGHQGNPIGALVFASRATDLASADRIAFALAVAGQISLAIALVRSFDEKDASERDARSNAAVLRLILESMGDGVLVCNERGELTHWNGAAVQLLGIQLEVGAREPWRELGTYHADKSTPLAPEEFPLTRALKGESVDNVEIFVRQPGVSDGLWLSVNARPLSHDHTDMRGGVLVFRDVTAEKASRVQLLVSDRMASLGTLAAGVGHEINNPLMAVLGNLEMAIEDLGVLAKHHKLELGELGDELRDAHEAAQRVRNIVRDLKLFSRSDDEARGEVDIERVLESSIRMVWNEIRHRAQLVRAYAPMPTVQANESRLGQVFLNLIVNAAQAIPEGRANQNEIRVTTGTAPDGRICVEIRDTGHGMSPETMARLFTPFFTTKPIGVGTGLGLAICHQLVTAIGGEITATSELGKGTAFQILLPPSPGLPVAAKVTGPTAPATRRGAVMIVDDEAVVATTLRRALADHDVTGFTDAHQAAKLIASGKRFDLILCDLMMPTATGMEFYDELMKIAPEQAQRIVFITGGAFTSYARSFLDRVPNQRMEKPFALDQLRTLVNERVRGA